MSRNVAILFTLNIVLTVLLSSILVSDKNFIPCWFLEKKRWLFYFNLKKKSSDKHILIFYFGQISIYYFLFMIKSLVTFSAFPIRDNSFHEWGATPKEPQNHAARKNWLLFSQVRIHVCFIFLINWVAELEFHLNFFTQEVIKERRAWSRRFTAQGQP